LASQLPNQTGALRRLSRVARRMVDASIGVSKLAKLITLALLAALLTACSSYPLSAELGGVNAQDPIARENARWLDWARANNGGPN
jgi:hypothetical protein